MLLYGSRLAPFVKGRARGNLAKSGHNLVLVSSNKRRLTAVSGEFVTLLLCLADMEPIGDLDEIFRRYRNSGLCHREGEWLRHVCRGQLCFIA